MDAGAGENPRFRTGGLAFQRRPGIQGFGGGMSPVTSGGPDSERLWGGNEKSPGGSFKNRALLFGRRIGKDPGKPAFGAGNGAYGPGRIGTALGRKGLCVFLRGDAGGGSSDKGRGADVFGGLWGGHYLSVLLPGGGGENADPRRSVFLSSPGR